MSNIRKDINFAENVLGFGGSVDKLNFINEFIKENNASIPSFTSKKFMSECADKYSKLSSEDRKVADDLLKKHRSYKSMQKWVGDKDSNYYRSRGFSHTWPSLLRINGILIYKGKPYDILDITDMPDPDNKGFLLRKVLISDDLGNKMTIKLRASDYIWAK